MTSEGSRLDVSVQVSAAIGSWRARFRPAGPAGQLTARLPLGVTVWLDRAEPALTLEVATDGSTDGSEAASLLRLLFGPQAADAAAAERSGLVAYEPQTTAAVYELRRLLAAVATADQRPEISVIDLVDWSARLGLQFAAAADDGTARLLNRLAITCAMRGIQALRALPPREQLRLRPEDDASLDGAIAMARRYAGGDIPVGVIARPADLMARLPADADHADGLEFGLNLALAGSGQGLRSAKRENNFARAADTWLVDLSGCALPVVLGRATLTRTRPGLYHLEAAVRLCELASDGTVVELTAAPGDGPLLWVRAFRRGDNAILYAAQCVIASSTLRATLHVSPEHQYEQSFLIDLVCDADATARTPRERRADLAREQGVQAAVRQSQAAARAQWADVARLWMNCARLWGAAGDEARQALAHSYAARASQAAGLPDTADAVRKARAGVERIDPRWLAPDLGEKAEADPLAVSALIQLSRVGNLITEWAVAELQQAVAEPVPALSRSYLQTVLALLPTAAGPWQARLRPERARARVAIAYEASLQDQTLPLASALMAPASADWAYLDRLGRQRFAAASRRLLEPDLTAGDQS